MVVKKQSRPNLSSRVRTLFILLACTSGVAWSASLQNSAPATDPVSGTTSAQSAASSTDQDDQRRTEARAYPHALGPVRDIRIRSARYFDADNRPCAVPPPRSRAVTSRQVRTFLRKAVPVSQVDVMNYYGAFGECMSDRVDVSFTDGRRVRMTFAADSNVAYLAPLVDGREGEVYFYVCEDCGR